MPGMGGHSRTFAEIKRLAWDQGIDLKVEKVAGVVPRQLRITLRSEPLPTLTWEGPEDEARTEANRLLERMLAA